MSEWYRSHSPRRIYHLRGPASSPCLTNVKSRDHDLVEAMSTTRSWMSALASYTRALQSGSRMSQSLCGGKRCGSSRLTTFKASISAINCRPVVARRRSVSTCSRRTHQLTASVKVQHAWSCGIALTALIRSKQSLRIG